MPTPPLMSERTEPNGPGWYDCWVAAALMCCWKTGYRSYPLGYTYQEREALERASKPGEAEEGGNVHDIDKGIAARYHMHLELVTDLKTELTGRITHGYMVAGHITAFPEFLRRWDPGFTGNHMVYVEPLGDARNVRLLDPLATWGFKGDVTSVQTILDFNKPFGPDHVRRATELSRGYRLTVKKFPRPRTFEVRAGTMLYAYDPNHPGGPVLTRKFASNSTASADAEVGVTWPDLEPQPVPHGWPFLRVTSGLAKGLLVVKNRVNLK